MLNRVRQPFNVNSIAQAAALAALADEDYVAESARLNRDGLLQLMRGLDAIGVDISALARQLSDGSRRRRGQRRRAVYEALLRSGVIVRPVANYGLPEWVRVTVGLPEENARFLTALGAALGR